MGGGPAFVGREGSCAPFFAYSKSSSENVIVPDGQRRIGKTSVLLQSEQQLRHDGPYHPVYFDLQDKAAWPLAQVVIQFAQRLAAELGLSPPIGWGERMHPSAFEMNSCTKY